MAENTQAAATENSVDARKRVYFAPNLRSEAAVYIASLLQVEGPAVQSNFITDAEQIEQHVASLPEGFGIQVQPVFSREVKTDDGKMSVTDIVIASVPDLTAIMSTPAGAGFLQSIVEERFGRTLKAALAHAEKTGEPVAFPTSLEEFISPTTRDTSLAEFKAIAKKYVQELRKANFKRMSVEVLKGVLMSKAYADAMYGSKWAPVWPAILQKMKADTLAAGGTGRIFDLWTTHRDETSIDQTAEVDLSALGIDVDIEDDETEAAA